MMSLDEPSIMEDSLPVMKAIKETAQEEKKDLEEEGVVEEEEAAPEEGKSNNDDAIGIKMYIVQLRVWKG